MEDIESSTFPVSTIRKCLLVTADNQAYTEDRSIIIGDMEQA